MSNGTKPPKKRGCLFYGCLILVGVGFAMVLTIILALYFARQWALRTINQYTDTSPATFEKVTYTPAERAEFQSRLTQFQQALQKSGSGYELVLTANDLNVLIAENADLKEKLFVSIDDDKIRGQVSLPLDTVIPREMQPNLRVLKGRYLNGSATFRVSLEGGALDVRMEALEAKGKPLDKLPLFGRVFADMKKRNLAAEIKQNSQDSKELDDIGKCESLRIKDGKVILRTK